MKYRRSQSGWLVIGIMVFTLVFLCLIYVTQWGDNPLPFTPFVILLLFFLMVIILFYKLTIVFERPVLYAIYGIGVVRLSFKIDQLLGIRVIKTPWYYGLGIRATSKGMLYNIQGSKALEIEYISNGKHKSAMIGTPEPLRLKQVIEEQYR